MTDLERSNPKAEQAVLGSILLTQRSMHAVLEIIRDPRVFFFPAHRRVFAAMLELHTNRQPIDILTIQHKLKEHGVDPDVAAIAGYAEAVPTAANVRYYAKQVAEKAALRAVEDHSKNCVAWLHEESVEQTLAYMKESANEISIEDMGDAPESVDQTVAAALWDLQELHEKDAQGPVSGLRSGFDGIDDLLCGLQRTELILVAGRPAMGKTAFSMDICLNAAAQEGTKWLYFSSETGRKQMGQRMLARASGIDLQKIRGVRINDDEWGQLARAAAWYEDLPVKMDYTAKLTPERVATRAIQQHHEGGLDGIVIDYVQRMKTVQDFDGNEHRRISYIAESLKDVAMQLEIPVIALCQLSRALERRPNKRPILSDLRESGKLEEEADTVLFVYRDHVYNPDRSSESEVEIICGKQRMGPLGTRKLHFEGPLVRFESSNSGQRAMF